MCCGHRRSKLEASIPGSPSPHQTPCSFEIEDRGVTILHGVVSGWNESQYLETSQDGGPLCTHRSFTVLQDFNKERIMMKTTTDSRAQQRQEHIALVENNFKTNSRWTQVRTLFMSSYSTSRDNKFMRTGTPRKRQNKIKGGRTLQSAWATGSDTVNGNETWPYQSHPGTNLTAATWSITDEPLAVNTTEYGNIVHMCNVCSCMRLKLNALSTQNCIQVCA
jgi:hypothetical protein